FPAVGAGADADRRLRPGQRRHPHDPRAIPDARGAARTRGGGELAVHRHLEPTRRLRIGRHRRLVRRRRLGAARRWRHAAQHRVVGLVVSQPAPCRPARRGGAGRGKSLGAAVMGEAHSLWTFSLGVYGRPGVAPACLVLQERHRLDINLLLFAAWAGAAHGHVLSDAEWRHAYATVGAWHAELVRGLRRLRTRLKDGPPPAPGPQTEGLRSLVKKSELDAERIEQDLLYGL